jgi:hypothetical protein
MGGKQNVDGKRLTPEEIEDILSGDIGLGARISTDRCHSACVLFCSDGWKKRAVGKGVPSSTPNRGRSRQVSHKALMAMEGGRGPARKLLAMHVTTAVLRLGALHPFPQRAQH